MANPRNKTEDNTKDKPEGPKWSRPRPLLEYLLGEATKHHTSEQRRAAFKKTDDFLSPQGRRFIFDFLRRPDTPFYDLAELAELAEQFAEHLNLGRKDLLNTGDLESGFSPSSWLESQFRPSYYYSIAARCESSPCWVFSRGARQAFETYSEAGNCFSRLIDAQVNILKELAESVGESDNAGLLGRCMSVIPFTRKEVEYFLGVDQILSQQKLDPGLPSDSKTGRSAMGYKGGTISALFGVIGHF